MANGTPDQKTNPSPRRPDSGLIHGNTRGPIGWIWTRIERRKSGVSIETSRSFPREIHEPVVRGLKDRPVRKKHGLLWFFRKKQ